MVLGDKLRSDRGLLGIGAWQNHELLKEGGGCLAAGGVGATEGAMDGGMLMLVMCDACECASRRTAEIELCRDEVLATLCTGDGGRDAGGDIVAGEQRAARDSGIAGSDMCCSVRGIG